MRMGRMILKMVMIIVVAVGIVACRRSVSFADQSNKMRIKVVGCVAIAKTTINEDIIMTRG